MLKRVLVTGAIIVGFGQYSAISNAHAATQNACANDIHVSFSEGAPVDKFQIKNNTKIWQIKSINIDLSSSNGRLIFDTISGGKGVEVFQPYEPVAGSAIISAFDLVEDGAEMINLQFEKFTKGDSFTFSIDVDDQLTNSELGQTRVTGGEMAQAKAVFQIENLDGSTATKIASFNEENEAILKATDCQS